MNSCEPTSNWPLLRSFHKGGLRPLSQLSNASSSKAKLCISCRNQLADLSAALAGVGAPDNAFPVSHGRGDQVRHGGTGPAHLSSRRAACGRENFRDDCGHIDEIKMKTRDVR